jgi:hypothetical protein
MPQQLEFDDLDIQIGDKPQHLLDGFERAP